MSYHDITEQAMQLTMRERLALLEALSRSLREELAPATLAPEDAVALVDRLFGVLRTDDPAPTDEELGEEYTNYLIRKYS